MLVDIHCCRMVNVYKIYINLKTMCLHLTSWVKIRAQKAYEPGTLSGKVCMSYEYETPAEEIIPFPLQPALLSSLSILSYSSFCSDSYCPCSSLWACHPAFIFFCFPVSLLSNSKLQSHLQASGDKSAYNLAFPPPCCGLVYSDLIKMHPSRTVEHYSLTAFQNL